MPRAILRQSEEDIPKRAGSLVGGQGSSSSDAAFEATAAAHYTHFALKRGFLGILMRSSVITAVCHLPKLATSALELVALL